MISWSRSRKSGSTPRRKFPARHRIANHPNNWNRSAWWRRSKVARSPPRMRWHFHSACFATARSLRSPENWATASCRSHKPFRAGPAGPPQSPALDPIRFRLKMFRKTNPAVPFPKAGSSSRIRCSFRRHISSGSRWSSPAFPAGRRYNPPGTHCPRSPRRCRSPSPAR